MNELSVSAIVVTFNRIVLLKECIAALRRQTANIVQIIVINNGSSDGTFEWLEAQSDIIAIHQSNVGGAGGFEKGLRTASQFNFDWYWLMDDDVEPHDDCLERMLEESSCSVLIPSRISSPFDAFHLPAKKFILNVPFLINNRILFDLSIDDLYCTKKSIQVEDFSFEGVLIRRDVVNKCGFPRGEFFINCDDYEYALRMRCRHGIELNWVPSAIIKRKITIDYKPGWKDYYAARNRAALLMVYGENIFVKFCAPLRLLVTAIKFTILLQPKISKYYFYALLDVLTWRFPVRFISR